MDPSTAKTLAKRLRKIQHALDEAIVALAAAAPRPMMKRKPAPTPAEVLSLLAVAEGGMSPEQIRVALEVTPGQAKGLLRRMLLTGAIVVVHSQTPPRAIYKKATATRQRELYLVAPDALS